MARATEKRRSRDEGSSALISMVLARGCAGIGLLGLASFAGLALATYAVTDAPFLGLPVRNAGGVAGAVLASALLRNVGYGAVLLVTAVAVLGLRLMAGRGLPHLASRFWAGAVLLVAATASIPALVVTAGDGVELGALGSFLAGNERWLLGTWGALLLNAVLLSIGGLVATGFSTGRALAAVGVGLGWVLAGLTAIVLHLVEALAVLLSRSRHALLRLAGGVEQGWRSIGVWREQRARHVRVEAARLAAEAPEAPPEPMPATQSRL